MKTRCKRVDATRTMLGTIGILTLLFVSGCADHLFFGTRSSIGLEASGTSALPNHVSLSYSRYEGAYVPGKSDGSGEGHSVFGGMDSDVKFWSGDFVISQTFATGEAAILATMPKNSKYTPTENELLPESRKPEPLLFTTQTTYGLDLRVGDTSIRPSMVLGYKREEATIIPISDSRKEVRSVYADIKISTVGKDDSGSSDNFSNLNGVRFQQTFATGRAARVLAATNDSVREKLNMAAGVKQLIRVEKDNATRILEHIKLNDEQVSADKWNQLIDGTQLEESAKLDNDESLQVMKRKLLNQYASFLEELIENID